MELNKDNIKKIIFIIAMAFLMFWAVINYEKVVVFMGYLMWLLNPLIIGIAIAFILNVCVRGIENRLFGPLDSRFGRVWGRLRRPAQHTAFDRDRYGNYCYTDNYDRAGGEKCGQNAH